ncbi:hypothetical protein EA769_02550 [Acinetobacter haemolyticus]|nr:hypothetical protein EA769_02550 [Acinetobacter haemolyticus]
MAFAKCVGFRGEAIGKQILDLEFQSGRNGCRYLNMQLKSYAIYDKKCLDKLSSITRLRKIVLLVVR